MLYRNLVKRSLDIVLASLMFMMLFPVFLILFFSLSFHFRGNPFFAQARPGKGQLPFNILKFKTMKDKFDVRGLPLPDAERITKFGRIIRKTSFDEIPQLLNVLKGDMSLVGPRPLLQEYLNLYSNEQSRRHTVLPGVTGWAQINGRNAISWEKKFELDIWYVTHQNFLLDLRILFQTLFNVLIGKGVTQQGQVTVQRFEGNVPKLNVDSPFDRKE